MADQEEHTGGMVALVPSPADIERLAVDGGEDPGELHLTLAYLGDDVTGWTEDQRDTVLAAARQAAGGGPFEATVMGHAVFNPNGDGGRDPAVVYLVTASQIPGIREQVAALDVSEHPVHLPHITAVYDQVHGHGSEVGDAGSGTPEDGSAGAGGGDAESKRLPGVAADPIVRSSAGVDPERQQGSTGDGDPSRRGSEARPTDRAVRGRAPHLPDMAMRGAGAPNGDDGGRTLISARDREAAHALLGAPDSVPPDRNARAEHLRSLPAGRGGPVPGAQPGTDQRTQPGQVKDARAAGAEREERSQSTIGEALRRMTYTGPITFDRLRVALADEVTDIPLAGPARDHPGDPDEDDVETKHDEEEGDPVDDVEVKRAGDRDDDGIPDANDPSPGGGGGGGGRSRADAGGGGKRKRRVASEAGERRYKLPIGTELGKARNADAQKAQDDPKSREAYEKLLTANPREYRTMLDDMSDAELEALTRTAYSFRSSNTQVVQARIALAGALRRRGKDVNDFGGLGKGGGGAGQGARPAARSSRSGSSGGRAKTNRAAPRSSGDPTWKGDEDWQARRRRRTKLGLQGQSNPPSPKQKRGEGDKLMTLHVYEDGSWQYKSAAADAEVVETSAGPYVFVESKREESGGMAQDWDDLDDAVEVKRTTTKPWEKPTSDDGAESAIGKGKDKGDDGDEWTIKTIGDLAAAVKRAKKIKDPDKQKTVRAHIRKRAAAIKAPNMIPKDWGSSGESGGGGGKGNLAPPFTKKNKKSVDPDTLDAHELAAWIERKAMSPDPRAARLREYWAHGEGRRKWRPGSGGDFNRLRNQLRKYVPARMLNGLTANIHKLATGQWPGRGRHHGKSLQGATVTLAPEQLAEVDALDPTTGDDTVLDDDAVSLALDRYSDMAEELTTEEEYEEALAREIDWELLPDGELERADGLDSDDDLNPDAEEDDREHEPDDAVDAVEEMFAD